MAGHPAAQPDSPEQVGSALSEVLERNIRTIIALRLKNARNRPWYDRAADAVTGFAGRVGFLVGNLAFFLGWFVINSGRVGITPFDPYPHSVLTTIVSLEAIMLSLFLLISQRRAGAEAELRADLALQMNLLTEHELTRVLQMLDAIQDRMDIDNNDDMELVKLEMGTKPEDVLAEIDRVRQRALKLYGR